MQHRLESKRRLRWLRWGALASAALTATAGAGIALAGAGESVELSAYYHQTSSWSTGYVAHYEIRNSGTVASEGWTLEFELPRGYRITSTWNGVLLHTENHYTITESPWNASIAPGNSVNVGFTVRGPGNADPMHCRINGDPCVSGNTTAPSSTTAPPESTTTGPPTSTSRPAPSTGQPAPSSRKPAPSTGQPAPSSRKPAPSTPAPQPEAEVVEFAPYVDTLLWPPFDLVRAAKRTGVDMFNLAFITAGGGCVPKWGGIVALGANPVTEQLDEFRAMGGEVRLSFGGALGTELALACDSVDALVAAYQKAIDATGVSAVDFDVEGSAITNTAANVRRAKAIAELQRQNPGLDVSFTLPVLPSGLTQHGVSLLKTVKRHGVEVDAVNIMAMNYGNGAAPNPEGRMAEYAIKAATATHQQIMEVFGVDEDTAWSMLAITPMIGVNNVESEVFLLEDARQLLDFAKSKDLAWLSMWSANRDRPCPDGPKRRADPSCSSIKQQPGAFMRVFEGT